MLQDLIATLKTVGKPTELHKTEDGTRVLILPYGGRILGVFAPGNDENFLWTNSALDSVESALSYYASDDWQNSGATEPGSLPKSNSSSPNFPTSIFPATGSPAHSTRAIMSLRKQRKGSSSPTA
jgi:hypothetical protein